MSRVFISAAVVAALFGLTTPAPASYGTFDKLAYLTFSAPVQIPGVTLGAGTYRFHLTNPDSSRNVLQVLSNDGTVVYAMFNTIPDSRTKVTVDPMVTFRETPEGVTPAVRSLFYGHEYKGYEFVYPAGGPNMIPAFFPQPEITFTPVPAAPFIEPELEVEPEPVAAVEPIAQAPVAPVAAAPEEPAELPRTASPLPFVAAGGLGSLFAGLALALGRRRTR
jgi:hypothetical protein